MKKLLFALFLTASISNVALAGESAADAISAAKAEIEKAGKTGFLWRDTGKFLKKAEEALGKGDEKKAMKLAKKAKFQAERAQEQAKAQANAGPRF